MKKISLIVLFLLISFGASGKASANSSNTPRPFEKIYPEIGYQSVEEALKAFENHFKHNVGEHHEKHRENRCNYIDSPFDMGWHANKEGWYSGSTTTTNCG